MEQIELLKRIGVRRKRKDGLVVKSFRRVTRLVVPHVSYDPNTMSGSLHNEGWAYKVPYCFRDALDLELSQRIKGKKTYSVWTQGPCLDFKEGDVLSPSNPNSDLMTLQVTYASPMGWDEARGEMFQGSVTFKEFSMEHGKLYEQGQKQCTQLEFLARLISGEVLHDRS